MKNFVAALFGGETVKVHRRGAIEQRERGIIAAIVRPDLVERDLRATGRVHVKTRGAMVFLEVALVGQLRRLGVQAGRLPQAREVLERAVSMDPNDELAKENLRYCRRQVARRKLDEVGNSQAAHRAPRTFS